MDLNAKSEPVVKSLPSAEELGVKSSRKTWPIILAAVVVALLLIGGFVLLILADASTTAEIRDLFIIFMALLLLLLMAAAIILVLQLATLINLLQNEIRPMLNTISETLNTVKGTTSFLTNNMVEPVIRLNEYLAGIRGIGDFIRLIRR